MQERESVNKSLRTMLEQPLEGSQRIQIGTVVIDNIANISGENFQVIIDKGNPLLGEILRDISSKEGGLETILKNPGMQQALGKEPISAELLTSLGQLVLDTDKRHFVTIYDNLPKGAKKAFSEEVIKEGGKGIVDAYQERDLLVKIGAMTQGTVAQKLGMQGKDFHKNPELLQEAKMEIMYNVLEEISARTGKPLIVYERYSNGTINANGKKTILLDAKTTKQIDSLIGEAVKQSANDINTQIDTLAKAAGKNLATLRDDDRATDYLLEAVRRTDIAKFNSGQQESLSGAEKNPLSKFTNVVQSFPEEKRVAIQQSAEKDMRIYEKEKEKEKTTEPVTVEKKESGFISFIKGILPKAARIAIFGLDKKDVVELIDKFRNANDPKGITKAAKDIAKYSEYFKDDHKHFLKASENIIAKASKGEEISVADKAVKVSLDGKDGMSLAEFNETLGKIKSGATKGLCNMNDLNQSKAVALSTDNVQALMSLYPSKALGTGIGIVAKKTDVEFDVAEREKSGRSAGTGVSGIREDLKRSYSFMLDSLDDMRKGAPEGSKASDQQINALAGTIAKEYPLVAHLIGMDPSQSQGKVALQNRGSLLQFGSDLNRDGGFADRWSERDGMSVEFKAKLNDFVQSGMNDPEKIKEFEVYMQATSTKLATTIEKDLQVLPKTKIQQERGGVQSEKPITYGGGKTTDNVLNDLAQHKKEVASGGHLAAALEKAKTPVVEVETAKSKTTQPILGSHTEALQKRTSSASIGTGTVSH